MLYKVARKLTEEYIDSLSFADRTGGLVRTMLDKRLGDKSFPMEINQDKAVCDNEYMRKLIPNSEYKSVMYWEQSQPPTVVAEHNMFYQAEAQISLVCWFNYQEVDPDMYDPAYLIAEIVKTIPFKIGNFECLTAVTCSYAGEKINDGSIFSQYTYNEPESQFFKYPYDYFVLNFDVSYRVVRDCFENDITSLPVSPIMLYMTDNVDKVVKVAGVSGREAQIQIYAADNTMLQSKALHEYSGEWQDYEFTPKTGLASIFRLDYGREYLRSIDMSDQNLYQISIPSDNNIRLEYIDFENTNITVEAYLDALIYHCYNSGVNNGYMDISGGTNASITAPIALAYIAEMVADRDWTILYNA